LDNDDALAAAIGALLLSSAARFPSLTMAQPRLLSRPDRRSKDSRPREQSRQRLFAVQRDQTTSVSPDDGDQIDPGRLIETAFRRPSHSDDPETYLLAWLALIGLHRAPRAASELKQRLLELPLETPTPWQRRLVSLLAFVAAHARPCCPISSFPEKGSS
jgi:hypothetical protein